MYSSSSSANAAREGRWIRTGKTFRKYILDIIAPEGRNKSEKWFSEKSYCIDCIIQEGLHIFLSVLFLVKSFLTYLTPYMFKAV